MLIGEQKVVCPPEAVRTAEDACGFRDGRGVASMFVHLGGRPGVAVGVERIVFEDDGEAAGEKWLSLFLQNRGDPFA